SGADRALETISSEYGADLLSSAKSMRAKPANDGIAFGLLECRIMRECKRDIEFGVRGGSRHFLDLGYRECIVERVSRTAVVKARSMSCVDSRPRNSVSATAIENAFSYS